MRRGLEQARTLLCAACEVGDRYEALYILSLTAGLLMGEALGLKWSDVDLRSGTLRVNRQLQRLRREEGQPARLAFSEPKNASRRTVPLTAIAVEALKRHGRRQAEEKMRTGPLYQDGDLVFASEIGTALDAQNVVNRHFKPLLKRAGLPDIRWHDLMLTHAPLLLSRGTHPTYVQKSLGHASVQLTLDR